MPRGTDDDGYGKRVPYGRCVRFVNLTWVLCAVRHGPRKSIYVIRIPREKKIKIKYIYRTPSRIWHVPFYYIGIIRPLYVFILQLLVTFFFLPHLTLVIIYVFIFDGRDEGPAISSVINYTRTVHRYPLHERQLNFVPSRLRSLWYPFLKFIVSWRRDWYSLGGFRFIDRRPLYFYTPDLPLLPCTTYVLCVTITTTTNKMRNKKKKKNFKRSTPHRFQDNKNFLSMEMFVPFSSPIAPLLLFFFFR